MQLMVIFCCFTS